METSVQWYQRTQSVIGKDGVQALHDTHGAIVGVGGVGGYSAELLVRSGIGELTLIDADCVEVTNINRQIVALHSTLGKKKVEALAERLKDINPEIKLHLLPIFLDAGNVANVLQEGRFDFVVDAIDTLPSKIALIIEAKKRSIPIVCSMGAGGKLHPEKIAFSPLSKTHHCPLSKALRIGLKHEGFEGDIPVVFSSEEITHKEKPIGSLAPCVAIFGAYLASYIINQIVTKV